jgi:hypothetical protein
MWLTEEEFAEVLAGYWEQQEDLASLSLHSSPRPSRKVPFWPRWAVALRRLYHRSLHAASPRS